MQPLAGEVLCTAMLMHNASACKCTSGFVYDGDIQSWPKKFVLGCVIPPAAAVARSHNLGQTFLANSVVSDITHIRPPPGIS